MAQPPSPGNADPGIDGGASTRSFNAQSQEIRVAERSGHIRDLTAVRCRPLRQTRRQATRQLCLPYSTAWAPPVRPGTTGDGQSAGPSCAEDDRWGHVGHEITELPRAYTIKARGTPPA